MSVAQPDVVGTPVRRVVVLALVLTALSLPAVLDSAAVQRASALYALAGQNSPYWQPQYALLLYVRVPAAAASAVVLFLLPGLLLSAAMGFTESLATWLLSAFTFSLVMVSTATGLVQALAGEPVVGATFVAVVAGCAAVCAAVAVLRAPRVPLSLFGDSRATTTTAGQAAAILAPTVVLVAGLLPKFLWESFNGDGAHAFEATRRLLNHPFPFWPASAGPIASFPGVTSMLFTYPNSWFVRLFGPVDASARLPVVLYLVLLVAVIGELVRGDRRRGRPPYTLLWCSLAGYVLAMAFSATYSPYSADIALPATQDTLLMVCFLASLWAFQRRARGWLVWWGVLTYLSLPSGALLLAFWIVAAVLVMRPIPWSLIRLTALTLLAAVAGGALVIRIFPVFGLPAPGSEYGVVGLLRDFAFLQITDWRRLLYAAAPGGLLPLLATLLWRRQDRFSRAVTLVTWAYFLFFYVQGNTALHHFVPAMVLPLLVFWRLLPDLGRRYVRPVAVSAAAAGFLLAMPTSWAPEREGRLVGAAIADRIGGYGRSSPDEFRASTLLTALFPLDWDPTVPQASYGGSPLVWNRYAHHDGGAPDSVNYMLLPAAAPSPAGWQRVDGDDASTLYVRDSTTWARQLAYRPVSTPGAPLLRVPRWVLFRSVPPAGGPPMLDVVKALEDAGFDLEPLLRRLGVTRPAR